MNNNRATGSWEALPFKGVNGIVTSVAKAQDGTYYFGGQFDTTTDGEAYSAPDTQPVNLDSVIVFTGNGADQAQDRDIICQSSTNSRGNWIMHDNIPGYWRAQFPLYITPTLFRLWNVDTTELPESDNRGTKTFSIMTQPTNQLLNLSYIDPVTHLVQYCTVCPLLPGSQAISGISSEGEGSGYQDFLVVTPVLLHAIQINIISWYGLGGGLGGIEVFQNEIFVRAVDSLNFASRCATTPVAAIAATASGTDKKDSMDAYSSFLGADWINMNMTDGWQTVLGASISATDDSLRKDAYVDLVPYLQESGFYDVYFYTPACHDSGDSSSKIAGNTTAPPSNACASRGFVDVSMYFGSPENMITTTLSQDNTVDKYDKIFSGMVAHSTGQFRPHVVVRPSIAKMGASGGSPLQTVIVDSIQFVKQATLNNTNSLLFYKPGVAAVKTETSRVSKMTAQGLDGSTWGNLPTQLPAGALINSLATYSGPMGSPSSSYQQLLFIGGEFQGPGYSNVVAWDGSKFVPMDESSSGSSSGLDGAVSSMVLDGATLYVTGKFQQTYDADSSSQQQQPLFGGLASFDIPTGTWTGLGNASVTFLPGAEFNSIQQSTGPEGQPQLIVNGKFTFAQDNQTITESIAVWDLNTLQWVPGGASPSPSSSSSSGVAGEFPFGFVRGHISYVNRILGSNSNYNSSGSPLASSPNNPVVLVAGKIDSLDTYHVQEPSNMVWLTSSGRLKTLNLSPHIAMSSKGFSAAATTSEATSRAFVGPTLTQALAKSNAGIVYYDNVNQEWVTIVAGAHEDGTVGAGSFATPSVPTVNHTEAVLPTFRDISLVSSEDSTTTTGTTITGEILALGINKDDSNGHVSSKDAGGELLLLGGHFKSSDNKIQGLAVFDLYTHQVVSPSLVPTLRAVRGRNGDPVIHVIKNRPGTSGKGTLIIAGDFAGVGTDVTCELICLWDPATARENLDKKKSMESSFKSVYGDSTSKKRLGQLQGVVHDIAFEDDKNMFVAGDLIVNGVACGVASFNFDQAKWTTFGSILQQNSSAASLLPGPDILTGPVTAIAHDSTFHRFFVAGKSSIDGSAYFRKWNGNRFIRVSSEFMPTSYIHRIEILPANNNAPLRSPPVTTSSVSSTTSRRSAATVAGTITNDNNDPDDYLDNEIIANSMDSTSSIPGFHGSTNKDAPLTTSATLSGIDHLDTTNILEQGFILLVSGRIVLGNPASSSIFVALNNDHQESSLAFFDGQSWFPFLQSSRNISNTVTKAPTTTTGAPLVGPGTLVVTHADHPVALPASSPSPAAAAGHKRQLSNPPAPLAPIAGAMMPRLPDRTRDQGVFRAIAIAHLPRIISRNYLAVPYVILISIAISLGLIFLIVLSGMAYVWLQRRFYPQDKYSGTRPRLGSSFMEDGYDGYLQRHGNNSQSSLGLSQGAAFAAGVGGEMSDKNSYKRKGSTGSVFSFGKPRPKQETPENSSALMASLGITGALEAAALAKRSKDQPGLHSQEPPQSGGGDGSASEGSFMALRRSLTLGRRNKLRDGINSPSTTGAAPPPPAGAVASSTVYRPNSTIEEATGALVTEFVKSHEQQLASSRSLQRDLPNAVRQDVEAAEEEEVEEEDDDPNAPPSPDRTSKKSRHSLPYRQASQDRDSSSSDLMNPINQGRFASLLAAANAPSTDVATTSQAGNRGSGAFDHTTSTPMPTSPATTMTTPGGAIGSATLGTSLFATAAFGAPNRNSNHSNSSASPHSGGETSSSGAGSAGSGVIYYAKYPFRAREIGELGFKTGEKILVVDMSDDIWWMGVIQDANGQQMHGVFPSNYVGPTP
ncbi:hypothetical protein BGZ83_007103 [Gryganskiella cystojenkinii]|nr:hypothetical protein BGZ83_007103 [Gryganskiella cystojenkinii]